MSLDVFAANGRRPLALPQAARHLDLGELRDHASVSARTGPPGQAGGFRRRDRCRRDRRRRSCSRCSWQRSVPTRCSTTSSRDPLELPTPGRVERRGLHVLLVASCSRWRGRAPGAPSATPRRAPRAHRSGRPAGLAARAAPALIVVVILPIVSMLWILVSRKNAGLHDLVCRTAVVYDWSRADAAWPEPVTEAVVPAPVAPALDR